MERVIIIGAGVAGWTAAIYAARAGLEPVLFTGIEEGGQLMLTTKVENFPGFPEGIMGPQLMTNLKKQAEKFGTKVISKSVISFGKRGDVYEIFTEKEKFSSSIVIVATGASARWLGLPNERDFQGRGLHTCATCDGFFYKDKEIMIVGGGNAAVEEAIFLAKFAKKVIIVHRRNNFRASEIMVRRVEENSKVEIMWNSEIVELKGKPPLKSVVIKNTKTRELKERDIDGVFLAIGHTPNTKIFKDLVDLDEHGFIKTDERKKTNLPGVFAAGDVQDSIYKQAITAAGTGCQAALEAEKYWEEIKEKK